MGAKCHPLYEFRNSVLLEISISYIGSASSVSFPIQLGPIRATWLIEALTEPLIARDFPNLNGGVMSDFAATDFPLPI